MVPFTKVAKEMRHGFGEENEESESEQVEGEMPVRTLGGAAHSFGLPRS